jgi:hypothetical protein
MVENISPKRSRKQSSATVTGASPKEAKQTSGSKRYNLALPIDLYEEVDRLAKKERLSVVEILRRALKLLLLVMSVQDKPGSAVILREGDRERELIVL